MSEAAKTISESLYAQARITPITPPNRVKTIEMLADRSMRVALNNGTSFDIGAGDIEIQAFVVYTMVNCDCQMTLEEAAAFERRAALAA